jgi:hypothetical protein
VAADDFITKNGGGKRSEIMSRQRSEKIVSCSIGRQKLGIYVENNKGKAISLQAWTGSEAPRFQDNRHMKVVTLLDPQEIFLVLISVRG